MLFRSKWKVIAKETRKAIDGTFSTEILQTYITKISDASTSVKQAYQDLRQHTTPDDKTRRRVDTCDAVSGKLMEHAEHSLELREKVPDTHKERAYWTETGSVLTRATSKRSSTCSRSSKFASSSSKQSSLTSSKKLEAAAELAATQATLKVLEDMELKEQELGNLEVENTKRLALQEEENAARKNVLEEKRRQLERLETVKKMNAAKARLQVYSRKSVRTKRYRSCSIAVSM